MVRFTFIRVSSLVGKRICSSVTRTHSPILCIYKCLPGDEPTRFETCSRQQKLNINLENCAFRWFVLCSYITVHGANNITFLQLLYIHVTLHRNRFLFK